MVSKLISSKQVNTSYIMLLVYSMCILSYGYNLLYILPIARSVMYAYTVDNSNISNIVSIGSISSSVWLIPIVYISIYKGIKYTLLIGLLLMSIGTCIQLFINYDFTYVYVGHFITHAGSPIINVLHTKFCTVWFDDKRRPFAVTLSSMMNMVGIMIAFIVPGLFVDEDLSLPVEVVKEQIFNFHIYLLATYGSLFFLVLFIFKERPDSYTTYEQEEQLIRKEFKMFTQAWELLKQPAFVFFILGIPIGTNALVLNQLLIVQLLTPFGYKQSTLQVAGTCIVIGMCIGSIYYSKYHIHTDNQLYRLKYMYICIILVYTGYCILIPYISTSIYLYILCICCGVVYMLPASIEIETFISIVVTTGKHRLVVASSMNRIVTSVSNYIVNECIKYQLYVNTIYSIHICFIYIICILFTTYICICILHVYYDILICNITSKYRLSYVSNRDVDVMNILVDTDIHVDN